MAQPISREKSSAEAPPRVVASSPNVLPIRMAPDSDPLDRFLPERSQRLAVPPARPRSPRLLIGLACVAVAAVAGFPYMQFRVGDVRPAPAPSLSGRATLNSRPDGAAVIVDGVSRGITPLELDLTAGSHEVIFKTGVAERRLAVTIEAGTRMSENVDLPNARPSSGQLEVTSDPPGARVTIDGAVAGVTPVTLRNVNAARHVVVVGQGDAVVNRTVEVTSGATASVFASLATPGTRAAGWFAVDSPLELRIIENGQLLGLSTAAPLMLRGGSHRFDLVNDAAEVRVTKTVTIDAGKSARVSVPLPNGRLFVNASPWAEVFVDGRSIGVTPLGEVAVPAGNREIVWRHPQLGERRRTVVIGAQTPTRVSVDFSR